MTHEVRGNQRMQLLAQASMTNYIPLLYQVVELFIRHQVVVGYIQKHVLKKWLQTIEFGLALMEIVFLQ